MNDANDYVNNLSQQLHWFPVEHINFKIANVTFNTVKLSIPYITHTLHIYIPSCAFTELLVTYRFPVPICLLFRSRAQH